MDDQAGPALSIRPETELDRDAIARVVTAAFGSGVEARLVDAIRASPYYCEGLALVAVLDGEVVGHVMISHAQLDDGTSVRDVAVLAPLAVAPEHQGAGVGSELVRRVTALADAAGEPVVVLEGSPAYYGRLGFEHALPLGIEIALPDWAPPQAAQVLRLSGYSASLRGRLVYPPAFAEALGS